MSSHQSHNLRHRSLMLALAPLALLLALTAGCGADERPPLSATQHNDADVTFASDMIQHHAQALAMVNLTRDRPLEPAVRELAEAIRDAQAPEIEQMADWLDEWGQEIPETMNDHMHHDMGTMPEGAEDVPGMMSGDDMAALENASDEEFQTLWLEMMVDHHRGAVEMARDEVADGRYRPAVDLAKSISDSQEAEIKEMKDLIAAP